jgi:dihydrodipicolinate synthase/N-acetylneuraminate lyase
MKNKKKYYGVVTPLVTPFGEDGSTDIKSLKKLLQFIIDAGTFPFILGTTGECMSMAVEQRIQLVRETAEFVGGKVTLYAGISDNAYSNTVFLAGEFKKMGVDVFVAHLPSYYPLNEKQIYNYFRDLADESPCPLMIYNIPSTTHTSITLEIVAELSKHPNICGLKDSERSLERIAKLAERYAHRDDFSILSGWTTQSAHTLLSGFDGIVPNTANLIPRLFTELYQAVSDDHNDKALDLQKKIDTWANLYQKDRSLGDVFAALKILMHEQGLCQPYLLPPLSPLSDEDKASLLRAKETLF